MNNPAAETAGYQRIRYLFCCHCHSRLSGTLQKDSGQARMTEKGNPVASPQGITSLTEILS